MLWATHAQLRAAMGLLLHIPVEVHLKTKAANKHPQCPHECNGWKHHAGHWVSCVVQAVVAVIDRGPNSDHILQEILI